MNKLKPKATLSSNVFGCMAANETKVILYYLPAYKILRKENQKFLAY